MRVQVHKVNALCFIVKHMQEVAMSQQYLSALFDYDTNYTEHIRKLELMWNAHINSFSQNNPYMPRASPIKACLSPTLGLLTASDSS